MIDEVIRHNHYNFNDAALRPKIFAIEKEMRNLPAIDPNCTFIELDVIHHHSDGVYARELHIPKDTVLVGKIHKYQNLNMLIKGELSVSIGDEIERIKAPYIVSSKPGTKRIAYAHEDSIWVTVHGTNEMDLAIIEQHFIAQDEAEYLAFCKQEPMLPLEAANVEY